MNTEMGEVFFVTCVFTYCFHVFTCFVLTFVLHVFFCITMPNDLLYIQRIDAFLSNDRTFLGREALLSGGNWGLTRKLFLYKICNM